MFEFIFNFIFYYFLPGAIYPSMLMSVLWLMILNFTYERMHQNKSYVFIKNKPNTDVTFALTFALFTVPFWHFAFVVLVTFGIVELYSKIASEWESDNDKHEINYYSQLHTIDKKQS